MRAAWPKQPMARPRRDARVGVARGALEQGVMRRRTGSFSGLRAKPIMAELIKWVLLGHSC